MYVWNLSHMDTTARLLLANATGFSFCNKAAPKSFEELSI